MEYRNNFGNLQERYVYLVNKLADAFIEYNGDEPVDENEAHIWVSENLFDVFDERDEDIYYGLRILSSNPDQYGGGEYEFTQSLINDVVDVLISKNNKVMAKQQIRLNEASLKEMIRQIIKETELYYDTDNFSGRWNKNIPDDYIDPEGSLDNPNQNPKSIEGWGEVYNSGDNKQDEIDYSWDQFNDKGIAPSVYGKFATTSKNNIDKEKDAAMDIRNNKKNWTDRQIKSAGKMKNKWVNGQRSLDDIDDAFYGSSIDEAINKAFKKIIG